MEVGVLVHVECGGRESGEIAGVALRGRGKSVSLIVKVGLG